MSCVCEIMHMDNMFEFENDLSQMLFTSEVLLAY